MHSKRPLVDALYLIIFISLLIFASAKSLLAGWTEDMRLTYRGYEIHPQVIARNDSVHVSWYQIAGPMHISYLRSTDGGSSWFLPLDLEAPDHYGLRHDMALSGSILFVGWQDIDTSWLDHPGNIAFALSQAGDEWGIPGYVFEPRRFQNSYAVSTTLQSDSIYAAYLGITPDSLGFHAVILKYSPDLGATWSDSLVVGWTGYLNGLRMRKCSGTIYVVWCGTNPERRRAFEVMTAISYDGGETWADEVQLSPDSADSQHPCIACDEETGNVAIGWADSRESHTFPGDLYIRITTDGGYSWGDVLPATRHHKVANSSIDVRGDSIWAVWSDWDASYGSNNTEICFSKSTDFGESWSTYERLTYAEGFSYTPWIFYDSSKLHVVWEEYRRPPNSGSDIYYKHWEPEVGIEDDNGNSLPGNIYLSAFPNPFNSATTITYGNLKGGEIKIFDIKGQLIKTFFTGGENEGRIEWDATDASGKKVSSGIYFARARYGSKATETSQSSNTLNLIYLK